MNIELETLQLTRYSEQKYGYLRDELENGSSASQYIYQREKNINKLELGFIIFNI